MRHPTLENALWLVVDALCAVVPFLPAIGGIVRAGKMLGKALDAERVLDRASDVGQGLMDAGRIRDASNADDLLRILDQTNRRTTVRLTGDFEVFRVFGGDSPRLSRSWTIVDPSQMSWIGYKLAAGLPDTNTMTHMVKGKLTAGTIVDIMPSRQFGSRLLGWLPGGMPEIRVNPQKITDLTDPIRLNW